MNLRLSHEIIIIYIFLKIKIYKVVIIIEIHIQRPQNSILSVYITTRHVSLSNATIIIHIHSSALALLY